MVDLMDFDSSGEATCIGFAAIGAVGGLLWLDERGLSLLFDELILRARTGIVRLATVMLF